MNNKLLLVIPVLCLFLIAGCGKKDDKTSTTPSTDKKTTTETTKKKTEVKKSTEPKKEVKPETPTSWTKLTSSDGKMTYSLPSEWIITENTSTKLATLSPDSTMGATVVEFGNDKITADDLLEMALADFDFQPEGEAHYVEIGDIEAYYVGAVGKINGQEMSMLIMSAIDGSSKANYVVYSYTPVQSYDKNKDTIENILFSVDFK